jgi:hypothetical protein
MLHVSTQNCYLGWYLPMPDGQTQIGLRPERFSAAEIDAYNQVVAVIGDLRPILVDYLALEADFEALTFTGKELAALFDNPAGAITIAGIDMVLAQTRVQRNLSNFLTAAKTFVERTQMRLGHNEAGAARPSAVWQRFVSLEKAVFEKSPGARILRLLGRYMRHFEAPVTIAPMTAAEGAALDFRLILDADALIRFDGLDGRLKAELLSLRDRRLDVLALADGFMAAHQSLMLSLIHDRASDLFALEQFEATITEQCSPPKGAIPIIWEGQHPQGGELDGSAYHFCFDESRFLFQLAQRLSEATT